MYEVQRRLSIVSVRSNLGSQRFEALTELEKLKSWHDDNDFMREKMIGLTTVFGGNCLGCGQYFEASKTFHSHESAFNFKPRFCHRCGTEPSDSYILATSCVSDYELSCKQCNNVYDPKLTAIEAGIDVAICDSCQMSNGLAVVQILIEADT